MFDILFVEVMVVLILITTILRNIYANQKYQIPYTLALLGSISLTVLLLKFNFFGLFDILQKSAIIEDLYKLLGSRFTQIEMNTFYILVLAILIFLACFLVLMLIGQLVMIGVYQKEKQDKTYVVKHNVALTTVLGIVKAVIYVYLYLLVLATILPVTGINLDQSWLMGEFTNRSLVYQALEDFARNHLGALFM